jgi:BioD-like phosphotransacetylase family protein
VNRQGLLEKIQKSFHSIAKHSAITVIEGTGHTGVGSIIDLNNAQVAALLKCPILLIAPGGLGSSFDELALNYIVCEKYGAKVAGVILNRVLEEKREMVLDYIPKALKRWDIPLLGCIPFSPFLSSPTMNDFEILFQTELWTGGEYRLRHFQDIRLVAGSVEMYRTRIIPNQLIITPAGREDIILALLTQIWDLKISHPEEDLRGGIILTGKSPPKNSIVEQIKKAKLPMLYAPVSR